MHVLLRQARAKVGYKQSALARDLRVSQQAVSLWESGQRTPNVHMARRIERVLGCQPGEIEWPEVEPEPDGEGKRDDVPAVGQ